MTTNIQTIRITTLHVLDQEEAVAFYCGVLGFEVTNDVDMGFMRWLTVALPSDPEHHILLQVPGAPVHDDETAATLRDLLTKGALGGIFLTSDDISATYDAVVAAGAEITQEIVEQPYGTDFGARDPFGNSVRVAQVQDVSNEEIQKQYDATRA
jgi:predicted enzyme related to lactoylglutathione lyase